MTASSSKFCQVVGLDGLPGDPDFATNAARVANRERLREALIAAAGDAASATPLLAKLDAAGVPASPINTIGEMFADPQVIARGMRLDLDDGHGNTLPSVRSPMLMSETPLAYERPSPRLGEHTRKKSLPNWRSTTNENRRTTDRRGARGQRRRAHLLRAGRKLSAVLDALYDSPIRTIVCRQEGGAAMMADCQGKLTGRPGICFVTRGPGATNASAGIHIAMQDSTPMILFIGQVARGIREREAFQEVDYKRFFGGIAKWVVEIDDAARIPEFVTRAFRRGDLGPPGPGRHRAARGHADRQVEAPACAALHAGRDAPGRRRDAPSSKSCSPRPGGPSRSSAARAGASRPSPISQRSAEAWALPVGCSFRRQMLFDHLHPNYAGDVGIGPNPKLAGRDQGSRPRAAGRRRGSARCPRRTIRC